MNFDKAEKGCVRAHPRAETRMLCSECLTAIVEQTREEILETLLADGCPHGCIGPCGFTARIKKAANG